MERPFTDALERAAPVFNPPRLNPSASNLSEDRMALGQGLLVLGRVLDGGGQVLRQPATTSLIDELRLDEFVRLNPNYTDASRAAASILKGLCKRGWMTRWMCPMRQSTRSRATTKGYIITPLGRSKLNELAGTPADPEPVADPDTTLRAVENNLDKLQPLLDEHERTTRAVSECDEVIGDLTKKMNDIQRELNGYIEIRREEQAKLDDITAKLKKLVG